MDAIDVVLATVTGEGQGSIAAIRRCVTHPLGGLAPSLRRLSALEPEPADRIAKAARDLALCHVSAIADVVGDERIDLIVVPGQTIFHAPPLSWQLLSPAPIAEAFGVPVLFDLRAADLAAGGQGAPITPLADFVLFRDEVETRAVLNLGGYANYTLLPRGCPRETVVREIRGGDICACNHVLDAIARTLLREPFDAGGRHAAGGEVCPPLRESLAILLRNQARSGRSLGTGDELGPWIDHHRGEHGSADLARSACEALAMVIMRTLEDVASPSGIGPVDRVLLAGGGVNNRVLCDALERHARACVELTDAYGVPAAYREAAAMAVLGALCQDEVPITLPAVTGVRDPAPLAGAWLFPNCRSAIRSAGSSR
jgi:1,6-anhydro-N-acetylmuramate kinase